MAAKHAKSIVQWLRPEEGGRKTPPSGPTYVTVAEFGDELPNPEEEAWSLVLEFQSQPDVELKQYALVRFLSPEAPEDLLCVGKRFRLYEGSQLVARGTVLEET